MDDNRLLIVDCKKDIDSWIMQVTDLLEDWEVTPVNELNDSSILSDHQNFKALLLNIDLDGRQYIQILEKINKTHPDLMCFMFLDNEDINKATRAIGYIHRYIEKPCEPSKFISILDNSLAMRRLLADDKLHKQLIMIKTLPSPPKIFCRLNEEIQSENASLHKIAEIIKNDIGITAKLFQMINSVFFSLKVRVESPLQAVNFLGLNTIRDLVLAISTFNQFPDSKISGFSIDDIYNYSLNIGKSAKIFATILGLSKHMIEDSFLAGIMHDIGKLIMTRHFETEFRKSLKLSKEKSMTLDQAESEVLGISDAEIGAFLLSLWGLPDSIVEAVAFHYLPSRLSNPLIDTLTTVHLAYGLDYDTRCKNFKNDETVLDVDYLSKLKLDGKMDSFRGFAMAGNVG